MEILIGVYKNGYELFLCELQHVNGEMRIAPIKNLCPLIVPADWARTIDKKIESRTK